MPIAVLVPLLAQYGLPLVQQIVAWIEQPSKTTITSADLAVLATLANYRSADALKAAGIQIVNGQVVPITP